MKMIHYWLYGVYEMKRGKLVNSKRRSFCIICILLLMVKINTWVSQGQGYLYIHRIELEQS